MAAWSSLFRHQTQKQLTGFQEILLPTEPILSSFCLRYGILLTLSESHMVTQRSWFLPSFTVLCIYIVVTKAIVLIQGMTLPHPQGITSLKVKSE